MKQKATVSHSGKCYHRSPDVVSRKIADEHILVPIRNTTWDGECIYTLNSIGSFIWELLDGHRSTTDLVEMIVQEYEVERHQAEHDLVNFLGQLEAIGVIVTIPEEE